ncbi:aspartate aminotransferase [Fusarium albosuccineum]|uniref:Aspartate aminotransferase n=1 Tax=Fusarium albosuccineum TaxID=1237068 RepID=A0A8H4KF96_9HYPO|nr:aspartate aminotransferase [Fusarium albosuccineum]
MAGVIQLGDAIKFAELAWTVWEYGWAREHNAGENYRDFGADVRTLHRSLVELEKAVGRARESLRNHGALDTDSLGGDRNSLLEIIGDYNANLTECHQLLEDNRRYAQTTGPIRNIDWNLNIMPQVEHLRSRIQMHTSRIQHVLKPFQIDLITNIHRDLDRRFRAMHKDVQDVKRTMNSLLKLQNPGLASKVEQEVEEELCSVEISDSLLGRMKRLDELQNPRRTSHWPGYISSLEEELSEEYSRVQSQIIIPSTSMYKDEMLAFWPEDEPRTAMTPIAPAVGYTCLFQGSLATLSPDISRREVQLLRQPDSDQRFRILETFESNTLPPRKDSKVLDFDLRSAVLIPLYADPMGTRSLEIMIVANELQHRYVFLCLQDVLAFQAAVTGFKVVDGYMESHAIAKFIIRGKERPEDVTIPPEDVTIQLWIPRGWTDTEDSTASTPADGPIDRSSGYRSSMPSLVESNWGWNGSNPVSERSQTMPIPSVRTSSLTNCSPNTAHSPTGTTMTTPEHQSRSYSISSYRSTTTNSSGMSHSSLGSEHNVTVRLEGSSISTGYGTIRQPPRNPLLVLFTKPKGPESRRSIVAIMLDKWTEPQMHRCKCLQSPQCPITALESSHQLIDARRFDGDKWDLLRLAASRGGEQRRWDGLIRVSIWFPAPDLRKKFGGGPCRCSKETEGELEACHLQGHQGLLGVAD